MSEEETKEVLAAAQNAVHEIDEKAWMFRCEICRETVKHLMAQLDIERAVAINLFVAWAMENAAATFREAVIKQGTFMQEYAKAWGPAIEQIKKDIEQDKPWERH